MEGIPDHTSHCPSWGGGHGGLGGSFPPRATREGERLHGWKKERRQGCQRLDRRRSRGKKTPTLGSPGEPRRTPRATKRPASFSIRRSGLGRHETPGPPVKPRRAQTLRGAHAVKAAEAIPGTREVRVHAVSFRWQKSIGRIARLARREVKSLVADAKASRALAGRKLEAPPDAGHEPREGEPVRGTSAFIQTLAHEPASGFRLTCSRDDRRRPRILTHAAFTGRVTPGS
jgi:hypothetical protein